LSLLAPSTIGSGDAVRELDIEAPESAQAFSASSIEALYRAQAARLRRYVSRRLGWDDAGDVVQEAFARLAGATSSGRTVIAVPEAFITTVATNVLRDRARASARHAIQLRNLEDWTVPSSHDPHALLEDRESLRAVGRALAAMNPRRRRIFLLHRAENLTYAEVAETVGMSEKGVKKQMAKALVELRRAAGRPA
jgi:RNA polymerase sigma-70 factor (ECF subfamily)